MKLFGIELCLLVGLAFATFGSPVQAGPYDALLALSSPAGRLIMKELNLSAETALAEVLQGSDLGAIESELQTIRTRFLQDRPFDRGLFRAGSSVRVSDEAAQSLRALLASEKTDALHALRFVSESEAASANVLRRFLDGVLPMPDAAQVPAALRVPTPDEALQLRAFCRDYVAAGLIADGAARGNALRRLLAENIELVIYALEGRDLSALMHEADLGLVGHTGNFVDIDELFVNAIRTQAEELARLIPAQDPELLKRFFGDEMTKQMTRFVGSRARQALAAGLRQLGQVGVGTRMRFLRLIGDPILLENAGKLDHLVATAKISDSPAVRKILDPNAGIDISFLPKRKRHLFGEMLSKYFDQLPVKAKSAMLLGVLRLPPNAPVEQQIAAVLQSSGPAAQKLFQLVGRDAKSPLIRAVMQELFSNIKPWEGDVIALVEEGLGIRVADHFSEFDVTPLASASVGQVHRARLKATGEWVIVKILKPGVRQAAMDEIATFRAIARNEFEIELVNNIEEALLRELDLRLETANLELGMQYASAKLNIRVAGPVWSFRSSENVMVQKLAEGTTLSKLEAPLEMTSPARVRKMDRAQRLATIAELRERGDSLERLLEHWFERALYGDGFFHADLHPGNIFYRRIFVRNQATGALTLIDFGSVGRLTGTHQKGFMMFVLGIVAKSPKSTLKALEAFATIPYANRPALLAEMERLFKSNLGLVERVHEALRLCIDQEMRIPTEIFQFSRGNLMIEKQLQEINRAMQAVDSSVKPYRAIHPYLKATARNPLAPLLVR